MATDRVTIGNVEITSFTDGAMAVDPCWFYPTVSAEAWQAHESTLTADGKASFNLGSFVVRSEGRTILVDTGMGARPAGAPETPWGDLLENLKAGGVDPNDIDTVFMTHLHLDHVGWNLLSPDGKYQPTFPRARYWASKGDWDYFRRPSALEANPSTRKRVLPLEELGVLELFDGEQALTGELTTLPTPGHTPGHMSVLISSQGEKGLILGDAAHHVVQVQHTDWSSRADVDVEQAQATRKALMERLERERLLVASGHFPAPGFGRVVRLEGRRYWQGL